MIELLFECLPSPKLSYYRTTEKCLRVFSYYDFIFNQLQRFLLCTFDYYFLGVVESTRDYRGT